MFKSQQKGQNLEMVNKNQSLERAGFVAILNGANCLSLASEYIIFLGVSRQVAPQVLRNTLRKGAG